ncbi:hypothetical protein Q4595_17430 [Wenyingzhuangia sp. 1_MG-2023]|nr:hypothetical protein [Wenyingzhuangia sp. 1_MG-2023]
MKVYHTIKMFFKNTENEFVATLNFEIFAFKIVSLLMIVFYSLKLKKVATLNFETEKNLKEFSLK